MFGMDGGGAAAGGKKFNSQQYRDKNDQLAQQYRDLDKERRPIMENYEKQAQDQLAQMIGDTSPAAKSMLDAATKGSDIYRDQSLPAYSKYISDAQNYDTPEKRQQAAGSAMTDVQAAGQASRDQAMSQLESYGIDPSQTRGAALDQNLRLSTALAQAKAGKDAALQVEETGHQRQTDALSASAQMAATANNQAATGSNLNTANVNAVNATANTYGNIFGTPASTLAAQSNLNQSSAQLKAAEQASKGGGGGGAAAIGSGIGTVAGAAAGAYFGAGNPAAISAGATAGGMVGGQAGTMVGGK